MTYVYSPHTTFDQKFQPERCAAAVRSNGWRWNQCTRPAKHKTKTEGKTHGFCDQHCPDKIAERERAKTDARHKAFNVKRTESEELYRLARQKQDAIGKVLRLIVNADTAPAGVPWLTTIRKKEWAEILATAKEAIRLE